MTSSTSTSSLPTTPNVDIPLHAGWLRISDGSASGVGSGDIYLTWVPVPRVHFRGKFSTLLMLDDDATVEFAVSRRRSHASARVVSSEIDGTGTYVTTTIDGGLLEPITVGSGRGLSVVEFAVPNFARLVRAVSVTFDGWTLELGNAIGKSEYDRLRKDGGYSLTTVGRLSRTSGGGFSAARSAEVFDALESFLGFVRGAWCRPSVLVGRDGTGVPVWHRWSASRVSSFAPRASWFPLAGQDAALGLFGTWWKLWKEPYWREVLERTTYYYVDANRPVADLGLITSQAALETLSRAVVVVDRALVHPTTFDALSYRAHQKIRDLLAAFGIPSPIPADLAALTSYAAPGSLDGPESISRLRNRLVHPIKKARMTTTSGATFDAWTLALWYVESALLSQLAYAGSVWSRVKADYVGFP